ncbi:reverse transcriptase domain-containing protein [Tanacetum coccineum]
MAERRRGKRQLPIPTWGILLYKICIAVLRTPEPYQRLWTKAFEQPGPIESSLCPAKCGRQHNLTSLVLKFRPRDNQEEVQSLIGKLAGKRPSELKQHLSKLLTLVAPRPQEELIMYLSASHGAVGAVLMTERGHGLYARAILYLPPDPCKISCGKKNPPDGIDAHLAGLSSVKRDPKEEWDTLSDVLSCTDGSGARLILTSPEGTEFTYALRFQFTALNNEAEYEALIAGLRIAAQMGVRHIQANVDSKLVANQVLEAYVAKEENMVKYLETYNSIVSGFDRFSISLCGLVIRRNTRRVCRPARGVAIRGSHGLRSGLLLAIQARDARETMRKCKDCQRHRRGSQIPDSSHVDLFYHVDRKQKPNGSKTSPLLLWAHRTMIKSSNDDTPFSLTYGMEAVIPAEIRMPTYRTTAVDVVHNDDELRLNLDLVKERRERAAIRKAQAKLKMKRYYNARVKNVTFRPGDFVYRSNDASHAVEGGKLGLKWEGPYEVLDALGDGAYKLRSSDGTVLPRTWNVTNLKKCYL